MSFWSRLLGGHSPGLRRSTRHRLGWPEDSESWHEREGVPAVQTDEPSEVTGEETPRKRNRPSKPAQRGRRQRKRR